MNSLKFIQINLHHAKGASGILSRRFVKENIDVALIQEPWCHKGKVLGLSTNPNKLLFDDSHPNPRAAILIRGNVKFVSLTEFISRDLVTLLMEVSTTRGKTEVIIASAYFPGDSDVVPPLEVEALVSYCKTHNKQFIIGCDANAHHTIWGSTDINKRGEDLFEYVMSSNIDICNRGDNPTFINAIRQEVMDLTFCSPKLSEQIVNWNVSEEITLSDHKHIIFNYNPGDIVKESFRNPRKTNWEKYLSLLSEERWDICENLNTPQKLEAASLRITEKVMHAFNESCPIIQRSSNKDASWWSKKLEKLRKNTRRLFNKAKITSDWDEYRKALTEYNKEVRKSRRRDWRLTCEMIECTPVVARLHKALSKDHTNGLGRLKKEDGSYTADSHETLIEMAKTHFPGSILVSGQNEGNEEDHSGINNTREETSDTAHTIFTRSKVEWAVNSFEPYKSPGVDGIFPILLQKGHGILIPLLTNVFKASLTLGYIPSTWRQSRVMFIPKAGKREKSLPKAYRPISLTSVMLKTMEKIIDLHIKSTHLIEKPLNKFQFAYQTGKSTETALHLLVSKIENSLETKETTLAAFLDIEGAFDNASYSSMKRAMERHNFDRSISNWIHAMLINREITAKLGDTSITMRATRGCPQGGVLSPLLWSIVVNDLLEKLGAKGFEVIGFADDIVIIVRGKFDDTISSRMQLALNYTLGWCKREGLSINPSKTTIVPFTRRRKNTFSTLRLNNVQIELSRQVKYLGVILDQKLTWNAHLEYAINKSKSALWVCSRTFGKKWGLKPKMIHWTYLTIVRPRITYASLVWWTKTTETSAKQKLEKLQRLASVSITGAMRSTPSKALDGILHLLPLHQFVQEEAMKSALRLQQTKHLCEGDFKGHLRILRNFQIDPILTNNRDWMAPRSNFEIPYNVVETDRSIWDEGGPSIRPGSIVFFTDGSKMDSSTGAGITGPGVDLSLPMGQWTTVFQSEIHAILACTQLCLARRYRHANICIFTDSQAALKALNAYICQSRQVWECILSLKQLSERNKVTLYWVPGHCGIEGNEKADTLARQASAMNFIGPEPFCGIPNSAIKMEFKKWEASKIAENWRNLSLCRQSKRFITPCVKNTHKLLSLNKNDLSTITGLLTGHCPSRYHLKHLKMVQNDVCRFCKLDSETSEHLLCECSALFRCRLKILGRAILEPSDIWSANPHTVLRFLKEAIPNWGEMHSQDNDHH